MATLFALPCHAADEARLAAFGQELDNLRNQYKLAGLSAAVVKNQQVIWEKGFGFQDIANSVPASPDTPYHIASITKTFASMLLMKCVEQGKIRLDDPIRNYTSLISESGVTIRHVLTMTSESRPPGESYNYNGNRYDALTPVIESCTGMEFRKAVSTDILESLRLLDTVPGQDLSAPSPSVAALYPAETLARYAAVLRRIAKPYAVDSAGRIVSTSYPPNYMGAAAGIISTVRDLARYDAAIDRHVFLTTATQQQAWTPHVNSRGQVLPYALGWFSQSGFGERLIWHYGQWTGFSSLILKVPARNLTLILLANGENLNAPFPVVRGDVTVSPFATAFLSMIGEPDVLRADSPAIASGGIVNGASFGPGIAPGAWISVFGQNLASVPEPGRLWTGGDIVNGVLPTSLEGVSVQIDNKPAAISYVSSRQLNVQVPAGITIGTTTLDVTSPSGKSTAVITISTFAPELFVSARTTGGEYAAAVTVQGGFVGMPEILPNSRPVRSGEIVLLYGTGFGPTSPDRPTGFLLEPASLATPVTVRIGGIEATVDFAGIVMPGLYQFNAHVPPLPDGDHPVTIQIANSTSAAVLLPVRN